MGSNKNMKIPKNLVELGDFTLKKFKKKKKKMGEVYDSKKELKKDYYKALTERLDEGVLDLIIKGYIPEMVNVRNNVFNIILDEDYIEYLTKRVKKDKYNNIKKYFPALIYEALQEIGKETAEANKNSETKITGITADLVELSESLLEKKIKKMNKKTELDKKICLDILSVVPNTKILKFNREYRFRILFKVLYDDAKERSIPFDGIMDILLEDEPNHAGNVILFSLLERKSKITGFTEKQMELFNAITKWTFEKLEDMSKRDITAILTEYCESRNRDLKAGKDGNRRYYISSLPESDYPSISQVTRKLKERNPDWEQFF